MTLGFSGRRFTAVLAASSLLLLASCSAPQDLSREYNIAETEGNTKSVDDITRCVQLIKNNRGGIYKAYVGWFYNVLDNRENLWSISVVEEMSGKPPFVFTRCSLPEYAGKVGEVIPESGKCNGISFPDYNLKQYMKEGDEIVVYYKTRDEGKFCLAHGSATRHIFSVKTKMFEVDDFRWRVEERRL